MFKKKKDKYEMKDKYETKNLVVANLEWVSNQETAYGPMIRQTIQKYIFEKIYEKGKIRYKEIFTGYVFDKDESVYFNKPNVVNIVSLKEKIPTIEDTVSKYAFLLISNEINDEMLTRRLKK